MPTNVHSNALSPAVHHPNADERRTSPMGEVGAFVAMVYAVAVVIAVCLPGTAGEPGPAPLPAIMTPATCLGVIALVRRGRRPIAPLPFGFRRLGLRGWAAAIVLPVLAIGGPFAVARLIGIVQFHDLGRFVSGAPVQLLLLVVLVIGEEIGWRGYMLPRLTTSMNPRSASLLTGLAQAVSHLPLILLTTSYDSAGNRVIVAIGAVAVITAGGVLFGWLRIHTGSIWPVAIAHAVVNVCIIESPTLVTHDPALAAYVAGEAGVLTFLAVSLIAVWLWKRAGWSQPTDR